MIQGYRTFAAARGTASRLRAAHSEFEFVARPINRENIDGPGEVFGRLLETKKP